MSLGSTATLAAEVLRLAADPQVRKLLWRVVDAISDGLSVDLVIRAPEPFDPLEEMRAAEETRQRAMRAETEPPPPSSEEGDDHGQG